MNKLQALLFAFLFFLPLSFVCAASWKLINDGSFETSILPNSDWNRCVTYSASNYYSDGSIFQRDANAGVYKTNGSYGFKFNQPSPLGDSSTGYSVISNNTFIRTIDTNMLLDYNLLCGTTGITYGKLIIAYATCNETNKSYPTTQISDCPTDNQNPIAACAPIVSTTKNCALDANGTVNFTLPANNYLWLMFNHYSGFVTARMYVDNIRYLSPDILTNTITEPTEPVNINTDFNILIKVQDSNYNYLTDAIVSVNFNNLGYANAPYNSSIGYYVFSVSGISISGDFNYAVNSGRTGDTNAYNEGTILIRTYLSDYLTITDIENVTHTLNSFNVDLDSTTETETIIFKAESSYASSLVVDYNLFNSLDDGRQYFIYTSSDGITYVFDDTLTYGGTYPIQKIWDNENDRYVYSFSDTLLATETKYYKLTYKMPMKYWKTMNTEWFNQLSAQQTTIEGQLTDLFSISSYSDLKNYLIEPIPAIDQTTYKNYELQFTANASATTTLLIGKIRNNDITTLSNLETFTITTDKKRYSATISASNFDDQIIIYTNASTTSQLYILDYALLDRGYFKKRLDLLQLSGAPLPIIVYYDFYEYVNEGKQFRATSEAYDREGDLNKLEIEVYLDVVTDANKVKKYSYELTSDDENIISLNYVLDQIVDLSGSQADMKNLRVKYTLYNLDGLAVSTQSKWVKFLQFPYFANDFEIYATQTSYKVGEKPQGQIYVETIALENFLGVKVKIWEDTNTYSDPSYATTYFKDSFNCEFGYCIYDYEILDYAFTENKLYHFAFIGLLTTQYESLATDSNMVLYYLDSYINLKQFKTARILQMRERTADPSAYKSTEKIPIVLELKDEELRNLKDKMNVFIYIELCDAQTAGNCDWQNKKFYPDSFIYDERTGYNYYIFNKYWTDESGNLLPDGNYIKFYAVPITTETDYNQTFLPTLARKCKGANYDAANFFANIWGVTLDILSSLAIGCTAGNFQEQIVTLTENTAQNDRILIDNSYAPSAPTQEAFVCINADQNNIYVNELKQRLLCAVWGTMGESEIDKMSLTITNKYSDLSIRDYPQYLTFDIPFDLIIYQQPQLLKTFLETNRRTTITTVGDMVTEGFNYLVTGIANNLISVIDATHITDGINNLGYDVNFNEAFSPDHIGFIFFYQIDGLKVVNVQDYIKPTQIRSPNNFIRYARENNLYLPENDETTITVLGSDMTEIMRVQQDNYLVINEAEQKSNIKKQNIDINSEIVYETAPTILTFNFISDMFYNNSLEVNRRYMPITIKAIIKRGFRLSDITEGVQALIRDPAGTTIGFIYSNVVIIFILGLIVLIGSVVYRNMTAGSR